MSTIKNNDSLSQCMVWSFSQMRDGLSEELRELKINVVEKVKSVVRFPFTILFVLSFLGPMCTLSNFLITDKCIGKAILNTAVGVSIGIFCVASVFALLAAFKGIDRYCFGDDRVYDEVK